MRFNRIHQNHKINKSNTSINHIKFIEWETCQKNSVKKTTPPITPKTIILKVIIPIIFNNNSINRDIHMPPAIAQIRIHKTKG